MLVLKTAFIAIAMIAGGCTAANEEAVPPMSPTIANLPHAQGQSFATLDDYLAHLRRMGAQDRPYYEEIAPGQYRRVGGRRPPGAQAAERIYTRAELMQEFGFTE